MLEVHSLIKGIKKEVKPPVDLRKYFDIWKTAAEKQGQTEFDFESFCAGYIIGGNPIFKQEILEITYKEKAIGRTFGDKPYRKRR